MRNDALTWIDSIEGDEALVSVSYVLHGNSSLNDSRQIIKNGLHVQEGRATVSTDLAHALRWATQAEKRQYSKSLTKRTQGEVGRIFVIKIPDTLHIGYGIFTSLSINQEQKEIKGAPIKYASGRKQLALYKTKDTEAARRNIELHKLKREITLPPETIAAVVHPSQELHELMAAFEARVRRFEEPDMPKTIEALQLLLRKDGLADTVVAELAVSTLESITISRMRHLLLDVKRVLGYKVRREDGTFDMRQVNPESVAASVRHLYQISHADGFCFGPEWLGSYLKSQSKVLLVELGLSL